MTEHQPALDTLPYGVYIATCKSGDKANGLTLGWVTQLSMDPALMGIAVFKEWFSHGLLKASDHFIVHLLADDQVELARKFGTTHGSDCDKFEGVDCEEGVAGIPVIRGCKTVFECRKIHEYEAGDHTLFVGEVLTAKIDPDKTEQVLDRSLFF